MFKLIICLGNPGPDYRHTYHNAGALLADYLAGSSALKMKNTRLFEYSRLHSGAILVKPLTFMNDSGAAALSALKYFKVGPEELLVAHDDSDLPLGEYRLSFDRGAGGHKGIVSIIGALKTKQFWRLRIGIRPAEKSGGAKRAKAGEFVLRNISEAALKKLYSAFSEAKTSVIENETLPPPMGVKEVRGS